MSSKIRDYINQVSTENDNRIESSEKRGAIQTEIDNIEKSVGLSNDGSLVVNQSTNYIKDATSIIHSINLLDREIKNTRDTLDILEDLSSALIRITNLEQHLNEAEGDHSNIRNEMDILRIKIEENIQKIENNAIDTWYELDLTRLGAGLQKDGTYLANIGANYISLATSLYDADNKLDAIIKSIKNDFEKITCFQKEINYSYEDQDLNNIKSKGVYIFKQSNLLNLPENWDPNEKYILNICGENNNFFTQKIHGSIGFAIRWYNGMSFEEWKVIV